MSPALAGALAGGSSYYLHRKTGGIYRVIQQEYIWVQPITAGQSLCPMYSNERPPTFKAFTATDDMPRGTHATYYVNVVTGERWARPSDMFYDGRFAQFERPPTSLLAALGAPAGAS